MPRQKRFTTKYPGVYFIEGTSPATGKPERIYYIRYRRDGKIIEEKAGRQFINDMTPARANTLRSERMEGKDLPNADRREQELSAKEEAANRWTVNRLWDEYKRQRNPKGIVSDENRYKNHLAALFGEKVPEDMITLDVDRLRLRLLKSRSPQTAKHVIALLRRIVLFGAKKGLCPPPNPARLQFEMPSVSNEKTEDLTSEELARLMEAIETDENIQAANFMKMALFTGMRRGELFKLQWSHVDFQRGFIAIRDPKGGPDQKIPLNDAARAVLEGHPRSESLFVFPGIHGDQRTEIRKPVNRIKERAGLPKDFRALHGLRHVFASMLASSGQVDMYTLQRLLTHKDPTMTQRYAHLRDETLQNASNLAGELMSAANPAKSGDAAGKIIPIKKK